MQWPFLNQMIGVLLRSTFTLLLVIHYITFYVQYNTHLGSVSLSPLRTPNNCHPLILKVDIIQILSLSIQRAVFVLESPNANPFFGFCIYIFQLLVDHGEDFRLVVTGRAPAFHYQEEYA